MNRRSAILLTVIVGALSFALALAVSPLILGQSEYVTIENTIEKTYLHDYDKEAVRDAGLKAMVASLKDPYSVYYTPEEYAAFKQEASGEYYGLGMVISEDENTGLAKVEYFFEDSAAKDAGLKEGDLIVSVNGEDVTGLSLQEVGVLCVGEEGTSIKLGVKRGEETFEYEVTRRAVHRDMVTYRMLDNGLGYMRILQFGGNCEELFSKGMGFFKDNGARGVLIDLRDDPGGYMETVVRVLDELLPEGTLVYTEDKNGRRETWTSDEAHIDMPLTLLVNGNTASAAEIFAGAVQDFGYGEVVGTKTYGKGVVQVVIPVSTGGGLKLTTSQYYTPSGRTIDKNGIYPDYYVKLQEDFILSPEKYSFEEDAQVKKAIEVLEQRIAGRQ